MVERSSHYNEVSLTSPLCYANGGAKSPLSTTLHFTAVLLHSVQWLSGGLFFWTQLYVVLRNFYEMVCFLLEIVVLKGIIDLMSSILSLFGILELVKPLYWVLGRI